MIERCPVCRKEHRGFPGECLLSASQTSVITGDRSYVEKMREYIKARPAWVKLWKRRQPNPVRRCPICKGKHLLQNCPWRVHPWQRHSPKYPHRNPLVESLVGGLGGGLGFAAALYGTKALFDKRSKKRNPVSSTSSISSNPVTLAKMGMDEVLSHLKGSGYSLYDNYNSTEAALKTARTLERQGYEVKVVTVPVPFAKRPEAAYPNWVLRRRKGLGGNPVRKRTECGVLLSQAARYEHERTCPRCIQLKQSRWEAIRAGVRAAKEKRGKPA